jgi:hypothetical protein
MNNNKSNKDNFKSRFQDYENEENINQAFDWLKKNIYKIKK